MFKALENVTQLVAWIQIAASPFLIGVVIGALVYLPNPSATSLKIGIAIAVAGLVVGILWATRVWKKTGTVAFMSRVIATPELDRKDTDDKQ